MHTLTSLSFPSADFGGSFESNLYFLITTLRMLIWEFLECNWSNRDFETNYFAYILERRYIFWNPCCCVTWFTGHAAAFLLLLLYPALSFIRWIKFLVGLLVCEDVRGKVILITGASSGIGEVCDSDAFQQIDHPPPPPQDFAFQKCCYLAQGSNSWEILLLSGAFSSGNSDWRYQFC
jgi:hypothetical protein